MARYVASYLFAGALGRAQQPIAVVDILAAIGKDSIFNFVKIHSTTRVFAVIQSALIPLRRKA
jgi:hypothetical protein